MTAAASPFGPRGVLALVGIGALAFVALLYAMGAGLTGSGGNDGDGHALSRSLMGYAALAKLAERSGMKVEVVRDGAQLDSPGLLVLTPPHDADVAALDRIVRERRYVGPTVVVTPKWYGVPLPADAARGQSGWVMLGGGTSPDWPGFHDEITLDLPGTTLPAPDRKNAAAIQWSARGTGGVLPDPKFVQTGSGMGLVPLIRPTSGSGMLAGYISDDGRYPALRAFSGKTAPLGGGDGDLFPVIFVFEPDLLGNYGLARRETALGALALLRAANAGSAGPIHFDVTLNGLGRTRNLLTLAFTPPFLAATLALLMAALVAAWRAFNRFGPPRVAGRAIAYGKTALVENSAGLIRRAGRLRLLGAPYAALVAVRLARLLGLPPGASAEAIDSAQTRRGLPGPSFTELSTALAKARAPHDLIRRAAALRSLEKAFNS